jgi:hypothetical protein
MTDPTTHALIEHYLDGTLSEADRAAFEARLSREPALRAAVDSQRAIDEALKRTFPARATPAAAILSQIEAAPPVRRIEPQARSPWLRRLAIAAALALVAVIAWQAWVYFQPSKKPKYLITAAQYFANVEKQGFKPNWVCENDQQTIDLFNKHFGQPMVIRSDDPNVKALGWNYVSLLSPNTLVLLAEAGQEHIMLFIDRKTLDDPVLMHQGCSGMNVHRKEVGDLVVYEFSRLPEPRVLDALVPPAS